MKKTMTARFEIRLYKQDLEMIDGYRRKQVIICSRSEAVRRLIEIGIKTYYKENS